MNANALSGLGAKRGGTSTSPLSPARSVRSWGYVKTSEIFRGEEALTRELMMLIFLGDSGETYMIMIVSLMLIFSVIPT